MSRFVSFLSHALISAPAPNKDSTDWRNNSRRESVAPKFTTKTDFSAPSFCNALTLEEDEEVQRFWGSHLGSVIHEDVNREFHPHTASSESFQGLEENSTAAKTESNFPYNSKVEQTVFSSCGPHLSSSTHDCLVSSRATLMNYHCTTLVSSSSYPIASALSLASSCNNVREDAAEEGMEKVPLPLIGFLAEKRWGRACDACLRCGFANLSTENLSRGELSHGHYRLSEFVAYTVSVLPGWFALVEQMNEMRPSSEALPTYLLEGCVIPSLVLLRHFLLLSQRFAVLDEVNEAESQTNVEEPLTSRYFVRRRMGDTILSCLALQRLVHLVRLLFRVHTPSEGTGGAMDVKGDEERDTSGGENRPISRRDGNGTPPCVASSSLDTRKSHATGSSSPKKLSFSSFSFSKIHTSSDALHHDIATNLLSVFSVLSLGETGNLRGCRDDKTLQDGAKVPCVSAWEKDEGEEGWRMGATALQCEAFGAAAPLIHFSLSFSLQVSSFSSAFIPLMELVLQIVMSTLTRLQGTCDVYTSLHGEMRTLLLQQLTPAIEMISSFLQSSNLHVSSSMLLLLVNRDFDSVLAQALGGLGDKYFSCGAASGEANRFAALHQECEKAVEEFLVPPSILGKSSSDAVEETTSCTSCCVFHTLKKVTSLKDLNAMLCSFPENEAVESFFNAIFYLRVAHRSAKFRFLKREKMKRQSRFSLRSPQRQGDVSFRGMDTLVLLMFRYCTPTFLNNSDGVSCLVSFLLRCLLDLLSSAETGRSVGRAETSQVLGEEWGTLLDCGILDLLWNNVLVAHAVQSCKVVFYGVMHVVCALADDYSGLERGEGSNLTRSVASCYRPSDSALGAITFLLMFLTDPKRLREVGSVKEGDNHHGASSLLLFSGASAVLAHAFSHHSPSFFFFGKDRDLLTEREYDKVLLQSCLSLATGSSHHTLSSPLRWLMILSELVVLNTSSSLVWRPLRVYPETLMELFDGALTRNSASNLLFRLLRCFSAQHSGQEKRNSKSPAGALLRQFVNAIRKVLQEACDAMDGRNDPQQAKKVIALVETLSRALCMTTEEENRASQDPNGAGVDVSSLQHTLCAGDPPLWFTSLVSFLKAYPCDTPLSFPLASAAFRCLFYLVKGSPACRTQLFGALNVQEFFDLCAERWEGHKLLGHTKFSAVVRSFVHLAWEHDGDPVFLSHAENQKLAVLNPGVLIPVLIRFASPSHFSNEQDALTFLLDYMLKSITNSATDCFLVSQAGVFNPLSQLLLMCLFEEGKQDLQKGGPHSAGVTPTKFLGTRIKLIRLMAQIAARHIDVRHLKQLISSLLINTNSTTRSLLLPDVTEVFSTSLKLWEETKLFPSSFIAIRENCERVGIRGDIEMFPVDGYSVSLWFCIQNSPEGNKRGQTFFSILHHKERRTLIKCFMNAENEICVSFLNKQKNSSEISLGLVVPEKTWSHLVVTHHRPRLLPASVEFQLQLNGKKVESHLVGYPTPEKGGGPYSFYVGVSGDVSQKFSSPLNRQQLLSKQAQLVGEVTKIYFFPKPLTVSEMDQLFYTAHPNKNPIPYLKDSLSKKSGDVPTFMKYSLGDLEKLQHPFGAIFVEKASILIDPRVSDMYYLYNAVDLLRGRSGTLERRLETFEGTLVVSGASDILESLCLTGAVNGVLLPMMALLLDPSLPFPPRLPSITKPLPSSFSSSSTSVSSSKRLLSTLSNLIDITMSFSSLEFMQEPLVGGGVFIVMSYVLEKLAPLLPVHMPTQLMNLCDVFLLNNPSLYSRVYASFFLCSKTLHGLSPTAQFHWWRCQIEAASQVSHPKKALMRAAGIQQFIAQEIIYNVEHLPKEEKIQKELFLLLDMVTSAPVTQSDATALLHLTVCAHDLFLQHSHLEVYCAEALYHVRFIFYRRGEELAPYLWKCGFLAALFPILTSATCSTTIRREAILMMCLLVSLSKNAQRLMNPTLEHTRGVDVIHAFRYIELGWLGDVLLPSTFTAETYMTFRSAITGDVMEHQQEVQYKPLQDNLRLKDFFPHVLSPAAHLLQYCSDIELLVFVAKDMAKLLGSNRGFPKAMVSFSGWFIALTEIYRSSITRAVRTTSASGAESSGQQLPPLPISVREEATSALSRWLDADALNPNNLPAQALLQNYATALGACLLHVVLNESYGITEFREVCAYIAMRDAHTLLCETLKNAVTGLENALLEDRTGDHSRFGIRERTENDIFSLIYIAEDYIFYSRFRSCGEDHDGKGTVGVTHEKDSRPYVENQNLYFTPFGEYKNETVRELGWLHLPLSIALLKCLTIYKPALGSDHQGSMMEWIPGYSPKEEEKKGKMHRVFARLLRVSASFVLRSPSSLEALIQIGHQFCDMIQWHSQASLWSLRGPKKIRYSPNWSDIKCGSFMGATMSAFYVYHELLNRRLRLLQEESIEGNAINVQLIQLLKRLFTLFRYQFTHLSIFSTSSPPKDEAVQASTPDWLSDFTLSSSLSCDTKEYEVVRSREDYNEFVSACLSLLQLGSRGEDEELTLRAQQKMKHQEMEVLQQSEKASEHKALIQSRLENYTKKHQSSSWWPHVDFSSSAKKDSESSRDGGFAKAFFAMRTSVWSLFRARIKGTMWSPAFSESYCSYSRLSLNQQRSFCRRKLILERAGTDHREAVRPQNAKLPDLSTDASGVKTASPSKMEKGPRHQGAMKNTFMNSPSEDEEEDVELLALKSKSMPASPLGSAFLEDEEWQNVDPSRYPSFPCEVVYLMQCWSASLVIQNTELSIIIDEENTAKNPPVAKGAESYVPRPESASLPLATLTHIAPGRRYRMRHTALLLLFSHQQSIMLNFSTVPALNMAANMLIQAAKKNVSTSPGNTGGNSEMKLPYIFATRSAKEPLFQQKLNDWKSNALSNFDYLMWINFFAGRSLNDLSQYPVFPWVLQNYTDKDPPDLTKESSFRDLRKPIGACGDLEREESVRQRYEEQNDLELSPAHYMSHYSSSSVVTFYMVRLEPFTSLHLVLQGGVLDFADRLFHSVPVAFQGVRTNFQNVRELIPEMYYLPELCINANRIPFGPTSTGERMNDLVLPPWAHNSPYEFVYRMREALESPYVSCHLHHWIDLIFGYKQTGKLALQSLNVFQAYTYEEMVRGSVDEPGMTDYFDNMGQTPIQLFKKSHPERRLVETKRLSHATRMTWQWVKLPSFPLIAHILPWNADKVVVISSRGTSLSLNVSAETSTAERWAASLRSVTTPLTSHKGEDSFALQSDSHDEMMVKNPFLLVLPSTHFPSRSADERAQSGVVLEDYDTCNTYCTATLAFREYNALFIAQSGLFDHTVVIRRAVPPGWRSPPVAPPVYLRAHHGRVTHMAVSEDSAFLVTGALDTTFVIWSCTFAPSRGLEVHFQYNIGTHEEYPSAVAVSSAMDLVVTASRDGILLLHSLSGGYMERRLEHPSRFSIDHLLVQNDCYLPNILFVSDTDSTIHLISLNGVLIRSMPLPGTRMNTWCSTTQQYLVVSFTTSPFQKSFETTFSTDPNSVLDPSQQVADSPVEVVAFLHAFYLITLKKVLLPSHTVVRNLAFEGFNSETETLLVATKTGSCAELGILKCL